SDQDERQTGGGSSTDRLAQKLGLLLIKLGLRDDTLIFQACEFGQLIRRAVRALARSRLLDVRPELVIPGLGVPSITLTHSFAPSYQVNEDAQERQNDHKNEPGCLPPSPQVVAAENVNDDPEENENPDDPQGEPQQRPKGTQQRVRIRQHLILQSC